MSELRRGRQPADRGMTLIEVLVAMALAGLLGSLLLGLAISTTNVAHTSSSSVDLDEEARVALERLGRELRQAQAVSAIEVDPVTGKFIGIRFRTDFNGDGFINAPSSSPSETVSASPTPGPGFVEPEIVAYRWLREGRELTLTDGSVSPPQTEPILAAEVTRFEVRLWSSRWEPLPANPSDGTAWSELEPGDPDPDAEGWWSPEALSYVDRVSIDLDVAVDGHSRTFTTDVFLRNTRVVGGSTSDSGGASS